MKIEIKHLSPYLPYGLCVWHENIDRIRFTMHPVGGSGFIGINEVISSTELYKPILRPLSDLTKNLFQFEYGQPTTLEDWINGNCDLGQLRWVLQDKAKEQRQERIMDLPYFVAEYLFKYHFDVFGLIQKGLAIDINTL